MKKYFLLILFTGFFYLVSIPCIAVGKGVNPVRHIKYMQVMDTIPEKKNAEVETKPGKTKQTDVEKKPVAKIIKVVPKAHKQPIPVPVKVKIKPITIPKPVIIKPIIKIGH